MLEWVLSSEGVIVGITITLKMTTSPIPLSRFCPIDITTATLSSEVKTLSRGSWLSYRPSTPYVLPDIQRVSGAVLREEPLREVRKDFKTRTSPNLPVLLKVTSDPPLVAKAWNPDDQFQGSISVFNRCLANSNELISISSVSAFYRFIGDKKYKPVKLTEILDGVILPVSIDPCQSRTFNFALTVPRTGPDEKIDERWSGRPSYLIAHHRPLRFKIALTDVEEEECSLVLDYVYPGPKSLPLAFEQDLAFISIDDPFAMYRWGIHVAKGLPGTSENAITIKDFQNFTLDTNRMKTIVYNALQSGESEIDINIGREKDEANFVWWSWKTWALVDLSCQRLYAFKFLLTKDILGTKGFACLAYVACPEYGEFYDETRPIQYAAETVEFPKLEPYIPDTPLPDDDLDDAVPDAPKATAAAITSTSAVANPSAQVAVAEPEELKQRLVSIDNSLTHIGDNLSKLPSIENSLSRLATSFEQFVEILKAKESRGDKDNN
ncbi:hypothetical protein GYMLUDRAFT_242796 [Collybiopsis luxurians FD-317 M1]|uniref:Uncharacterized protein n=1 Tax=Collybiopsis luxurians FD-317 M1 TaxID=944289 RepID=A0A0D0BFK1_9AGAR|nr:hypothetical protein GYMLUDRAFT_242796 [Collybiopsis luxurians FD-317 M1]